MDEARSGLRRLFIPVLVILPVLAVLVALGTWQVQRMGWKTQLLAEIAAAEASPAIPLPATPQPWTKVAVTGRLDHGREALLGLEVRGPVLGTHLLVPLLREDAPPILVDRGWVPLESTRPIDRPEGQVTLEGYVRPGESAGLFAATDDAAGRRFYSFVPDAIGAALGLEQVAPFGLVVLGTATGLPDPARTLPRPTNSHLGYVITWYGLALSLLGVFAAWARRRLKDPA